MMDLLLTKNPIINSLHAKSINDYTSKYFETATQLNIATGFISNESIAELKRLVEYRKHSLNLSLFIGMNYIDGFTKLQYDAVKELGANLLANGIGNVYVSPKALFHGKMYSFLKGEQCLGAFVGSSNLGSFIGTSQNLIESDVFFEADYGMQVHNRIVEITNILGEPISQAKPIESFKEPTTALLDGFEYVRKLNSDEKAKCLLQASQNTIRIPLKTEEKSNLNAYFGAGKVKGRFSRRDYYEVEIIISTKLPNRSIFPVSDDGNFTVVTGDGYMFECACQGTNSKNFRSAHDLKILGRWIKGQMENCGALKLGEKVTEETLRKFGKTTMVLTQSVDKDFWILTLE